VIITRTPLRISLGGGGTDLPSYYMGRGGIVVSAAIAKYIYIGINRTFTDDYFIKYSELERVARVEDIQHPIVREVLLLHELAPRLEIVSLADIPAGTGLGSSGSFTVGLLRAVYALKRVHVAANALAEEACHVELGRLGRAVGRQDQYIAAFGGLTCFEFDPDGRVTVSPVQIPHAALLDLEEHLLLFFTGYGRDAEEHLREQKTRSEDGDERMLRNLDAIAEIGRDVRDALEMGDCRRFAALMHAHWDVKRDRSAGVSSTRIDDWYDLGMAHGALGGKLVGAGGGGFLMFYAEEPAALRSAMARAGLAEVRFTFDHDGSSVIVRD
jgi:D-glycero-alpha-D-manno-heptose-7-phosphate kinase